MRGVGFRRSQAPLAAAGKVRPDPFPVGTGGLCAALNASVCFSAVIQLVDAVQRERALQELGVPIGVAEELGGVRAHGAIGGGLLCCGNRRHGSPCQSF